MKTDDWKQELPEITFSVRQALQIISWMNPGRRAPSFSWASNLVWKEGQVAYVPLSYKANGRGQLDLASVVALATFWELSSMKVARQNFPDLMKQIRDKIGRLEPVSFRISEQVEVKIDIGKIANAVRRLSRGESESSTKAVAGDLPRSAAHDTQAKDRDT